MSWSNPASCNCTNIIILKARVWKTSLTAFPPYNHIPAKCWRAHRHSQLQHSQFSSQHNVSRPPLGNFGSTPHIPQFYQQQQQQIVQQMHQPHQQQYQEYREYQEPTYREMEERSRQQFYLHDSPPPPQRRTWAQHAVAQQDAQELRGWQVGCVAT